MGLSKLHQSVADENKKISTLPRLFIDLLLRGTKQEVRG